MQDDARKFLVGLAIEKTLLEINKSYLDKFESMIYERHQCSILDCYEHPEYLKTILKDLYGNSSAVIIEYIQKQLEEFETQQGVSYFILGISG